MLNPEQLGSFVEWYQRCITGDEKGQAQIFPDRLFQGFGLQGSLDVGGMAEFRVLKSAEDGGGTSFADYAWKPVGLIEMKKVRRKSFSAPQFEDVVGTRSTASPISPHDVNPPAGNERTTDDSRASAEKKNIRDAVERSPTTMIRKIEAVAEAGREVRRVRAEALSKMKGGLRVLYRTNKSPNESKKENPSPPPARLKIIPRQRIW